MLGSSVAERAAARKPHMDLRRGVRRDLAERMVEAAPYLAGPDRYLVEGVFRDGRSIAELAAAWGQSPPPRYAPRALRRRLHRVVERVHSPKFQMVVEWRGSWEPVRRRVATACVLHGLTFREAAESLGMSVHAVRRHFDAIEGVLGVIGAAR